RDRRIRQRARLPDAALWRDPTDLRRRDRSRPRQARHRRGLRGAGTDGGAETREGKEGCATAREEKVKCGLICSHSMDTLRCAPSPRRGEGWGEGVTIYREIQFPSPPPS